MQGFVVSAAGCLANVKPSSASLLTQTLSAGGTLLHRTDKAIILPQQKHWHGPGQLLEARRCGAVKTRPPSATAAWGPWDPLGWDAGPHGMDGGGHFSARSLVPQTFSNLLSTPQPMSPLSNLNLSHHRY